MYFFLPVIVENGKSIIKNSQIDMKENKKIQKKVFSMIN